LIKSSKYVKYIAGRYFMFTVVSEKIKTGSLVGFRKTHKDPEVQRLLTGWIGAYGRGPFEVCGKIDSSHVAIRETIGEREGKVMHLGSSEEPFIHASYVEPWQS
jgi:hypothetical protein